MKRYYIVLFAVLFLLGCESEAEKKYAERQTKRQDQAIDQCIQAGGIPIYSNWNARMIDCKFPPEHK